MKFLKSLKRELILLSRSIYFYCEIAVAAVFLVGLMIVMPENFDTRATEYLFINTINARELETAMFEAAGEYTAEDITIKNRGGEIPARLYTTEQKYQYVIDDYAAFIALCEDEGHIGTVINGPGSSRPYMEFYLQGNETARFTEYALLALSADQTDITAAAAAREIIVLEPGARVLSDRQSVLPMMLTVNSVVVGIFIAAAYIVEDKKTKVIKALRVQPAHMASYLMSKTAAVLLTMLATCFIVAVPVMGASANYALLLITVICGGFCTIAAGALIASFSDDIQKALTSVFALMIILMIPCLLSLLPSVDFALLKVIPSYYIVECVKLSLLNTEAGYIIITAGLLLAAGAVIMAIAARRYKHA